MILVVGLRSDGLRVEDREFPGGDGDQPGLHELVIKGILFLFD